jgi:hypothetical protein
MAVRLSSFRRMGMVLGAMLAAAALVISWGLVVRTLRNATPVPSPDRAPASVIWGDRVFSSPAELERWLRSRGENYARWSANHPEAVAALEHRRPAAISTSTRQHETTKSPSSVAPTVTAATVTRVSAAATVPRVRETATASQAGSSTWLLQLVTFALIAVAIVCAYASLLPAALRVRYPSLARTIAPFREALFAAAVAVVVGLLISNVLN